MFKIDAPIFRRCFDIRHRIATSSATLLLLLFLTSSAQAAFQEQLWGARPAGLGGAFTALADDANAPAYNPAGVSLVNHNEMTFMYAQLFTGLTLNSGNDETSKLGMNYFSFVPQIKDRRYGSYAVSWSNFQATHLLREDTLTFSVADLYRFDDLSTKPILAYGANLKWLKHSFTTDSLTAGDPVFQNGNSASAMSGDLGLMFRPNLVLLPGLKFGLSGQNINQPNVGLQSTDRVPARYTLGLAYQDLRFRLINPAIDVSHRDGRTLVSYAWEGWMFKDTFAFRMGGNVDQIGGGFGYQFHLFDGISVRLDYSLIWPLDVQGTNGSHRFSLTTDF